MEHINIPAMYCPFPSRISPYVEAVDERTRTWVQRLGLVQKESALRRFNAARFAWLTARVYPTAGLDELTLLNDWLVWLFLFDDQFDDSPYGQQPEYVATVINGYIDLLKKMDIPEGPAGGAFQDLWRRSLPGMSAAWQERFLEHLVAYFETYNWTVRNRALGRVPAMDDYIAVRQHSGGMTIGIDLIEFATHGELPTALLKSGAFQALASTTNNVVCWSNDIFSLEKESARGDVNNLVIIVRHQQNVALQEAVEHVNALVTQQVQLFEQVERSLPEFAPELAPTVAVFLAGLKDWMRANLDWSLQTKHYSQVEHTLPGKQVSYLESILAPLQELQ
ncbi:MAG: hypothetical protein NVS2B12_32360 [Ktedonobacteraceae bacterium]